QLQPAGRRAARLRGGLQQPPQAQREQGRLVVHVLEGLLAQVAAERVGAHQRQHRQHQHEQVRHQQPAVQRQHQPQPGAAHPPNR
ncbi:MAG: hypothetical protein ACK559_23775, partial [bacterium]